MTLHTHMLHQEFETDAHHDKTSESNKKKQSDKHNKNQGLSKFNKNQQNQCASSQSISSTKKSKKKRSLTIITVPCTVGHTSGAMSPTN